MSVCDRLTLPNSASLFLYKRRFGFGLGRVLSTVTNATLKILWPDLNGFDIAPVTSPGMDVKATAAATTLA